MLNEDTIFRISKSNASTEVPDEIHDHPDMGFDVKGLLGYCLRRPNGWHLKVSQLIAAVPEGRTAIYTLIRKLTDFGFVRRQQERLPNGRMGRVIYHIYDTPFLDESLAIQGNSPEAGKPEAVKRGINNNTNQLLIKKNNNCYVENEISEETDFFMHDWNACESAESDFVTAVEEAVAVKNIPESVLTAQAETIEAQLAPDALEESDHPEIEQNKATAHTETTKLWPCYDALPKSKSCLKHCLTREYSVELVLTQSLTVTQFAIVADVAKFFSVRGGEKELAEWIALSLLSPLAFGRCQTFLHKINAIIKKIKEGTFNRPRYSAQASAQKSPPKNALSAAHNLIAKCIGATPEDAQHKILCEKIRTISIQLSSSQSAMVQFKNLPDIAKEHENSVVQYQEILAGLRLEAEKFNQSNKAQSGVTQYVQ